jgi:hypothetical protein
MNFRAQWWLMCSSLPDLNWACLRIYEGDNCFLFGMAIVCSVILLQIQVADKFMPERVIRIVDNNFLINLFLLSSS